MRSLVVALLVGLTVAVVTIPVLATTVEAGLGWRILNYASFSPFSVNSDLRWVGLRLRYLNTVIGGGFSVTDDPQPFIESLIPISRLFASPNYVFITTGATLVEGYSSSLWSLGPGWSMLPWIGIEVDLIRFRWLSITGKIETYLPKNALPDKLGIGIVIYVLPLRLSY